MSEIKIKSDFIGHVESGGLFVARINKEVVIDTSHPVARGYVDLRTEKYKEYGYLDSTLPKDIDSDDERSDHYVAMSPNADGTGNILGTLRMISRDATDKNPLPIENFFDDSLNGKVTPKAAEISRLIVERVKHHEEVRTALIQTALKETVSNGTKQTLAMVDPWFRNYLRDKIMIPMTEVTEERKFGKYPEAQVGIDVDFCTLNRRIGIKGLSAVYAEEGIEYYRF